jgi:predicted membrane protein
MRRDGMKHMRDGMKNMRDGVRHVRERRRLKPGSVIPGLLIMTFGLVILLDNLDLIESGQVLRYWPVILIAVGVKHLYEARDGGSATSGTVLAAVGSLLLLNTLDVLDFNIFQLWPLFLVVFGFHMIMRTVSGPSQPIEASGSSETSFAFLGGVERRNSSPDFTGGSATAIMGGVELDLSRAEMTGELAVFNVFAMMGGIELRIPESWALENKVAPILGGVEDKTRAPADASKKLVVQGMALMGGVEIKN